MKKILSFLILAVVAAPLLLMADSTYNAPQGPFVGKTGGVISDNGSVAIGDGTSALAHGITASYWANAAVNIVPGDPVVFVATGVSKTTTPADPAFAGIALSTALFGQLVQVGAEGTVVGLLANTVAIGGKVITSSTAGVLTPVAAVAETNLTGLSNTAIVGRALQAKTFTGTNVRCLILLNR